MNERRGFWSAAWLAWLLAGLGSFAWLECLALRQHRLPTLSSTLRRWMGIRPVTRRGRVLPLLLPAGAIWLTHHLLHEGAET